MSVFERASSELLLRTVETGQIELFTRVNKLEAQSDHVQIVAYLAAGAALLLGSINFALLLILIGRLS